VRCLITLLVLFAASWSPSADGKKKAPRRCSTPPKDVAKVWPAEGIAIAPMDEDNKRRIKLTRREAGAIRCHLERYLRSRRAKRAVAKDFRGRLTNWQVGGLDADGPRIGTFWVHLGDRDNEIILRTTLALRRHGRYGLSATLRRTGSRWRVRRFSDWRAHRRR